MLDLLGDGVEADVGVGTDLFSGGHSGGVGTATEVGGGMEVDDNSAVRRERPNFC